MYMYQQASGKARALMAGNYTLHAVTRKLSYHKDDRAMRPIYECPEKFRESLSTPTATFPEIFNGFLFRSIL